MFLICTLIVVTICLSAVLFHSGWPGSDDNYRTLDRTVVYAQHFQRGDFFPIWSSDDSVGMGSPLPLFYHKTFYYISGSLLLIIGSVKVAVIAATAIFMLVGAYGLRASMRKLTNHPILLLLIPQLLLMSSYTTTDLLIRGAAAEFSAMMLIPWLLWWCLKLLKDKHFSYLIVPIMFLLVQAHNVVALFAIILPLIASLLFLTSTKRQERLVYLRRLIISILTTSLLLAPSLLLQLAFLGEYNPGRVTQNGLAASQNFIPLSEYLFYYWFNLWEIALLLLLTTGLWVYQIRWRRTVWRDFSGSIVNRFLVFSIGIYILLQIPLAKPLYTHLRPLEVLQFPWRLLVFVVPLSILIITSLIAANSPQFQPKLGVLKKSFVVLWLGITLLNGPLTKLPSRYIDSSKLVYYKNSNAPAVGLGLRLAAGGEYLPQIYNGSKELSGLQVKKVYKELYSNNRRLQIITGGPCQVQQHPDKGYETLTILFKVDCEAAAQIALPISYNRYTRIHDQVLDRDLEYQRYYPADPRIVVNLPGATHTILEVSLPTAGRVLGELL